MKAVMFPGQGSQYKGMGKKLFPKYRTEVNKASNILGYDLEELCLKDPKRELGKTQFTQPALYVVNALSYYEQQQELTSDYLIGHSLGEYNALLAAGAFDFETGLKIVQKRGELMAAASGGGMAAVLGIDVELLKMKLDKVEYQDIDIANLNTPTQTVISGPQSIINTVVKDFGSQQINIIPLFVTAPFHSRYMKSVSEEFTSFINGYEFSPLKTPVVSNFTADLYDNNIKDLLSQQIANSVRWIETIQLLIRKGVTDYQEINSVILTKMVEEIKTSYSSAPIDKV